MQVPTLGNELSQRGNATNNPFVSPNPGFPAPAAGKAEAIVPDTIKSVFDYANNVYETRSKQIQEAETSILIAGTGAEASRRGQGVFNSLRESDAPDDQFRPAIVSAMQQYYDELSIDDPVIKARAYEQIQRVSLALEASADDFIISRKKDRLIADSDQKLFNLSTEYINAPNETHRKLLEQNAQSIIDANISMGAMSRESGVKTMIAFKSDGVAGVASKAIIDGNLGFAQEYVNSKKDVLAPDKQLQILNMLDNEQRRIKDKAVRDFLGRADDYSKYVENTGIRDKAFEDNARQTLGEDSQEYKKFQDIIEIAGKKSEYLTTFQKQDAIQAQQTLATMVRELETGNYPQEDAEMKRQEVELAQKVYSAVMKQRAEMPYDAAASAFPGIKTDADAIAAQKLWKIPESNIGVLPDAAAKQIVETLTSTSDPAVIIQTMKGLKDAKGDNFHYVMNDLRRNKLPSEFQYLANINSDIDKTLAVAASQVAVQGASKVIQDSEGLVDNEFKNKLNEKLVEYRLSKGTSGRPVTPDESSFLTATATQLVRMGRTQDTAIDIISNSFNSKFNYIQSGPDNKTIRVPVEYDPDVVESFADSFFTGRQPKARFFLKQKGSQKFETEILWDDIKRNGYFATTDDDRGLILNHGESNVVIVDDANKTYDVLYKSFKELIDGQKAGAQQRTEDAIRMMGM